MPSRELGCFFLMRRLEFLRCLFHRIGRISQPIFFFLDLFGEIRVVLRQLRHGIRGLFQLRLRIV